MNKTKCKKRMVPESIVEILCEVLQHVHEHPQEKLIDEWAIRGEMPPMTEHEEWQYEVRMRWWEEQLTEIAKKLSVEVHSKFLDGDFDALLDYYKE